MRSWELKKKKLYPFIYFWLYWTFCYCTWASSVAVGRAFSLLVVHGLLIGATSLVAEHGL